MARAKACIIHHTQIIAYLDCNYLDHDTITWLSDTFSLWFLVHKICCAAYALFAVI